MFRYLILVILGISFCFSGFKVGIDFASEFESDFGSSDLKKGLSFAYESKAPKNDINYGFEYLMSTGIEDGDGAEISMFTIYGMYPFSKSETVTFFGKLGYSNPKIDFDDDDINDVISVDGGIMYGFQANFENI